MSYNYKNQTKHSVLASPANWNVACSSHNIENKMCSLGVKNNHSLSNFAKCNYGNKEM